MSFGGEMLQAITFSDLAHHYGTALTSLRVAYMKLTDEHYLETMKRYFCAFLYNLFTLVPSYCFLLHSQT